jgi:hypothetical protein
VYALDPLTRAILAAAAPLPVPARRPMKYILVYCVRDAFRSAAAVGQLSAGISTLLNDLLPFLSNGSMPKSVARYLFRRRSQPDRA